MTHEGLRRRVVTANLELVRLELAILTFGNASAVDRDVGIVAIKPSGVPYHELTAESVPVLDLADGAVLEGDRRPSSDTPTHLHLYRSFAGVGGVVHTHSGSAVSWAQAERDVPCFGTTHADHFHGPIPVTRRLRSDEVREKYELDTGRVIVECFAQRRLDPLDVPGVLVAGHGPFAWGMTVEKAVDNAIALESIARMALDTLRINPDAAEIDRFLMERHHRRKHGADAYYGQKQLGQ